MNNKNLNLVSNKLVNAFLKNKIINPISDKYTKKLSNAQKFRKICESKIKKPIIGFKAGGTGIPVIKKLKEKEPFYASVYKHNVLKNNKSVKINKYTLGIELEVCYLLRKNFLLLVLQCVHPVRIKRNKMKTNFFQENFVILSNSHR